MLNEAIEQKKLYEKEIKQLELENKEQGIVLNKITTGDEYQREIKQLIEELRIQKDKNDKLSNQFKKEEETRTRQAEKMKEIEGKNKQYYNELLSLKE